MTSWSFKCDGQPVSVWEPKDGTYKGLIIISHGAGGSMLDHRGTAARLSQEGWVVCAPLHVGDNFRDKSLLGTDAYWVVRPREISRTLDVILGHPQLSGKINPKRIGAIGFSAGGYTVLAASGGQPNLQKLNKHCENPSNDPRFCAFGDATTPVRRQQFLGSIMHDERIKALALIAPVGAIFGERALDNVKSDVLLIRAGKDQILHAPYHAENIHRLLRQSHEYKTIDDLHHFGFIEPFPWYLKPFGFEAAKDPKGYHRRKNLKLLNEKIVQFMAKSLK